MTNGKTGKGNLYYLDYVNLFVNVAAGAEVLLRETGN